MPTPRPTLKRGRKIRAQIEQALHGLKDTVCDGFFYSVALAFLNMLLTLDNHDLARIFARFDGVSEWPLSLWKKWKPCTLKTAAYLHWINGAPCPPKAAYDYFVAHPKQLLGWYRFVAQHIREAAARAPNCVQRRLDFVFSIRRAADSEMLFKSVLCSLLAENERYRDPRIPGICSLVFPSESGMTCYRHQPTMPHPQAELDDRFIYRTGGNLYKSQMLSASEGRMFVPLLRAHAEGYTVEEAIAGANSRVNDSPYSPRPRWSA